MTYRPGKKKNTGDQPITQEEYTTQRASLSWRLTSKEKKHIIGSIESRDNQIALQQIKKLLNY